MNRKQIIQSSLCLLVLMQTARAQEGARPSQHTPKPISVQSLSTQKTITITVKEDGKKVSYTGVPLRALLAQDYPIGSMPEWKQLAKQEVIVEVTGQDGFPALISATEIAMNESGDKYILATERDKKPLPDKSVQLICPMDEFHVRWVRQVAGLRIVSLKER